MGDYKMKAHGHTLTGAITLIALGTGFASLSFAQTDRRTERTPTADRDFAPASPSVDLTQGVFIASPEAEKHGLRRYDGQKLLNTEGAELGTIKDLIVHPQTSRVRYLVVSSGGVLGGIGNSLRLVPAEVVRHGRQSNRLEIDILQSAWLQVPPISDENYVIDRFDISTAQHDAMVQRFGSSSQPSRPVSAVPAPSSQPEISGLIRGSVLCGKNVRVGDRNVGEIENIIVDLGRGTAAALFDSSGELTGTKAKYIIPLSRLVFGRTARAPVGISLTRADFDRAQPDNFGSLDHAASAFPRTSTEAGLTPTGRTASDVSLNSNSDAGASARAVRLAINDNPALVAEPVQVRAENGKVVLSGSVRTEAIRDSLEQTARRVVPAGTIENRVRIENR
jgi:sporulation protein YlmC with PRC-barrel domain